MNWLIRVVTRVRKNGRLKTDRIINHVITAFSSKKALKQLRQVYGANAVFGRVTRTDLEEGIYFPLEKQIKVLNQEMRKFVLDGLKKRDKQWLTLTQSQSQVD